MTDSFKIQGFEFELEPLKVREARALYPNIANLMAPVMVTLAASGNVLDDPVAHLDEMFSTLAKNIGSLSAATREIPVLQDAFVKVSKVKFDGSSNLMVDLGPFFDEVFTRRHFLVVNWLLHCVKIEFADFLGELMRLAAEQKRKAESQSPSPSGSTGTSGE